MKKLFLLLIAGLMVVQVSSAQDAKRDLRNAKRALSSYGLDPNGNAEKLGEAKSLIDNVVTTEEFANSFEAWFVRGNIHNEMVSADMMQKSFNPAYQNKYPSAPMEGMESYFKAYELAEKSFQKKDAAKGTGDVLSGVLNYGFDRYTENDQASAFKAFESSLKAHEILIENKLPSPFATEDDINNQIFTVAVTALGSGNNAAAEKYLTQLKNKNVERADVYDQLYKLYKAQGREDEAKAMLKAGRTKFPDDVNLLFSEINQALQENKLDDLVASLKEAIRKEPDNLSLYATLGNVYDNLFRITEDKAQKQSYFDQAFETFNKALELDANHFESVYSLGALYYNKAAEMTQQLGELANDYSSAGLKKYEEKQKQVNDIFNEALPYFLKADTINDKDKNTLIALKEIYARLNQLDKSNNYKERLEKLN